MSCEKTFIPIPFDNCTVPCTRTLTINGVTYDLSQDRSWTVSGGGTGTVTSVATDSTLIGGPITTTGTLGINLSNSNTWAALQNFNSCIAFPVGAWALFNGPYDLNWRMGISSSFTCTYIGTATSIQVTVGQGSSGPDGFAVGQCCGGTSIFEVNGYDKSAYFLGNVTLRGTTAYYSDNTGTYLNTRISSGYIRTTDNLGTTRVELKTASDASFNVVAFVSPTGELDLSTATLSAYRSQVYQDASGTIALLSDIPSSLPPSGSAGGDLSGTYPNPTVNQIQGKAIATLTIGLFKYNGSSWVFDTTAYGTGTVTSVQLAAGTGISLSGTNPITTSGIITVTNSAPDQVVVLNNGTGISATGTYPNFTITNTAPDQTVALTAGTGISVSGTYPNFTITNTSPSSGGTVTSVDCTVPAAFAVSGTPITTSGTIDITAVGDSSQYIKGDGTLGNFAMLSGAGGVTFYLNGNTSEGTIAGDQYYQLSSAPGTGSTATFSATGSSVLARFITDSGSPNRVLIPAGIWQFQVYLAVSSNGGSPTISADIKKYDGSTFTTLATTTSEVVNNGTITDLYLFNASVPQTTLLSTDRIAIVFNIVAGGRTIYLYTEGNTYSSVITSFPRGISSLNGLTVSIQTFQTTTSGTDFTISSSLAGGVGVHKFNFPIASASNTGKLSSTDWTTFSNKQNAITTGTTSQYFRGDLSLATFPTSLPPSGTAGGDLSGTYPNPTVNQIQGKAIATLVTGLLKYNGTSWIFDTNTYLTANQTITWTASGDISGSSSGTTSISPSLTVTGVQGKAITLATGFLKYNGGAWVFDNTSYGTGTVTSIATGSGLTGGTITTSGTISLANIAAYSVLANTSGSSAAPSNALAYTSTPTASVLPLYDANKNLSAVNHIKGYTSTPTAGGTTTLTVGSNYQQYFTGSSTQTIVLPVTSTLVTGMQYDIVNLSSGALTVNSSGGNLVQTIAAGYTALITCVGTTHTTAADWSVFYSLNNGGGGTVTSVGLSTNATWLTVGSSPVTSSGTITINKTTGQTANQFLATPNGSTGVVDLRAIVTADLPTSVQTGTIGACFNGGGAVIQTNYQAAITCPFGMTITNWQLVSIGTSGLLSGSIVVDVYRSGSSIIGSGNKPTLSSASSGNAAVSGWTSTTISAGDILLFNVTSATTVTNVTLTITGTKS